MVKSFSVVPRIKIVSKAAVSWCPTLERVIVVFVPQRGHLLYCGGKNLCFFWVKTPNPLCILLNRGFPLFPGGDLVVNPGFPGKHCEISLPHNVENDFCGNIRCEIQPRMVHNGQ